MQPAPRSAVELFRRVPRARGRPCRKRLGWICLAVGLLSAAAIGGWSILAPEPSVLAPEPSIAEEPPFAEADEIPAELLRLSEESVVSIDGATGFVVDAGGLVMTCYHVAEQLHPTHVRFRDGTRAKIAGVVAADRGKDLALLRIETDRKLIPLALAADLPSLGEELVMFNRSSVWNNPAVQGRAGRTFKRGSTHVLVAMVWTVRGCSGGPLVNLRGYVVAIAYRAYGAGPPSDSYFDNHFEYPACFAVSAVDMREFLAAAGSECHELSILATAGKVGLEIKD